MTSGRRSQRLRLSMLTPSENGQMLMFFALLVFPMSAALAVVAVDASSWQSERRGAQKDADFSALAGAFSLLDPAASDSDAQAKATTNAIANDDAGNATTDAITVGDDCTASGGGRSVDTIIRHNARAFFAEIFGIRAAPRIRGHARACAGSVTATRGLMSLEVDASRDDPCLPGGAPNFDQLCGLDFGNDRGNYPRALVRLDDTDCSSNGAPTAIDMSASGTDSAGRCAVNTSGNCARRGPWQDCVALENTVGLRVIDDLHARLTTHEATTCGMDTFADAVTLAFENTDDERKSVYEANDCNPDVEGVQQTPRLTSIVVLRDTPGKPRGGRRADSISGFAGFYIVGCSAAPGIIDESDTRLNRDCAQDPSADHEIAYGRFVNLIVPNAEIGDFSASTTLSGVALVQ